MLCEFDRTSRAIFLQDEINEWIDSIENITIKDIKYTHHAGNHSALIIYETGINL